MNENGKRSTKKKHCTNKYTQCDIRGNNKKYIAAMAAAIYEIADEKYELK